MSKAVAGTWQARYRCQEPLCGRNRKPGRIYCPAHDRPDEQIRRETWLREHPGEQLPCRGCGHRRIHHARMMYATRDRRWRAVGEEMVPCSIPECGCAEYAP